MSSVTSKKIEKLISAKSDKVKGKNVSSDEDDISEVETSEEEVLDKNVPKKTGKLKIERMSQHEQILHRPGMYIGGTKLIEQPKAWVFKDGKILAQKATYSEGLVRLFMEVAGNVIDNGWRSKQYDIPAKLMKITINKETGAFCVWNDGKPIDQGPFLDKDNKPTGETTPDVIFGTLNTSSNYNDDEQRKTSGLHGQGVKLVNIFSKYFKINLFNPESGFYEKVWENNMFKVNPPKKENVKSKYPKGDGKTGYTMIEWIPDYKLFHMEGIDDDLMMVLEKTVHDYALIAGLNGIKTLYNGEEVSVSDLKSYASLYYNEIPEEMLTLKSQDCTVLLAPKPNSNIKNDLMHISFLNGILTYDGGVHVDQWEEALFRPIVNKVNKTDPEKKKGAKKTNRPTIDITHVRKYFALFVVAEADKPEFRGQNKTYFNGPPVKVNVKRTDITKLGKWSFMDRIEESIKMKEFTELKKEGKKKRGFVKVDGLDDANNAGDKKEGKNCILCLCEGSSAATYIVEGSQYGIEGFKGRDYIGFFELRGKFLNVRKASITTILKNTEVKGIIKALGLEYGLDYTQVENRNSLRYGKIYTVCDSDVDGLHITGLLYNFFDTLFPSLLESGDFFNFLRIPIVKITMKNEQLSFLYYEESKKYLLTHDIPKKYIRYFKGLGTSTKKDVEHDFGRYPVCMLRDEAGSKLLESVFNDDSDFRKDWLINYTPLDMKRTTPDYEVEELRVGDYIDNEMILYSIDSCRRAIPSVLDGLKESHRKVLTAAIKKKLTYKKPVLKVAQFAGYVAEHMSYHHGEQNLYDTITKMAQRFTGSNNVPLLDDEGQFGSRRGGGSNLSIGKDAANARYIFTRMDMLTRLIFRPEDDPYLPDRVDEGEVVEKEYYMPIVPMLLINGSSGIGTGSSSSVPQYNIIDIIEWIKIWLNVDGKVKTVSESGLTFRETPDLVPYYRGFKGEITVDGDKITTKGILEQIDPKKWRITEIPIGRLNTSIQKFKERLDQMVEDKQLKRVINNSPNGNTVDFVIIPDEDGVNPNYKNLKLVDTLSTNNMVLFDMDNKLRKFGDVDEILCYFCEERYKLYGIRKEGQLKELRLDLKWVSNKIKFINAIDDGKLIILDRDEDVLEKDMTKMGFDKKPKEAKHKVAEVEDDEDGDNDEEEDEGTIRETFDYLLNMKARTLNIRSKVYKGLVKEKEDLDKKIKVLEGKSIKDIWIAELDEVKDAYGEWEKKEDKKNRGASGKKGKTNKKKGKKDSKDESEE